MFQLTDACLDFRANKPSDVISTLVSIYDSKDLFVKELQVLLAQRLLVVKDGNFEKEVRFLVVSWSKKSDFQKERLTISFQRRNIEILKIRFGEAALQVCEVMLRDMTDSRRIDQHVQSQHTVCLLFPSAAWTHAVPVVGYASYHYIATFLACSGVDRDDHAGPVRKV